MIVTIHQPEHLVWLGLLNKISQADTFVVFDNTQFKKNYFENRNKIKVKDGWMWLTVPIKEHVLATQIKDIKISYDKNWQKKYLTSLRQNYSRTKFFEIYYPRIEYIINKKYELLLDLNLELLFFLLDSFGIHKNVIKSSELKLPSGINGGSDWCLEICKAVRADVYLAGSTAKDYLDEDSFKRSKIELIFHKFDHPVYNQINGDFQPFMSAVDALFNLGEGAKKLVLNS